MTRLRRSDHNSQSRSLGSESDSTFSSGILGFAAPRQMFGSIWNVLLCLLVIALLLGTIEGCGGSNEDFDRKPPTGFGVLIVNNNSSDDIDVFVDSVFVFRAGDDGAGFYDLEPGVYRVVLAERGGSRSFLSDVDILEGRQTILDVAPSIGSTYGVSIRIESS